MSNKTATAPKATETIETVKSTEFSNEKKKVLDAEGFETVGKDGQVIIHDEKNIGDVTQGIFIGQGRQIGLDSTHGPKDTYAIVTTQGLKLLPACTVLDRHFKGGEIDSTMFGKREYKITYLGEKESDNGKYRNYEIKHKDAMKPLVAGIDF